MCYIVNEKHETRDLKDVSKRPERSEIGWQSYLHLYPSISRAITFSPALIGQLCVNASRLELSRLGTPVHYWTLDSHAGHYEHSHEMYVS